MTRCHCEKMERDVTHPKMDWSSGDLPTAFKNFKSHCEFMFGGPLKSKTEEEWCNYIMLWVGEKGRELHSTWNLSAEDAKKREKYYEQLEAYVKPKSNKIYSRYKFKSRVQKEDEPFEQFVMDLRILIKDCGYATDELKNEMVRDHIVFGIRNGKIREELIKEGSDLTLDKCIDIARTYELSQTQSKKMENEDKSVNYCQAKPKKKGKSPGKQQYKQKDKYQKKQSKDKKESKNKCTRCGNEPHPFAKCPAKGKQCSKCNLHNHYASECRSRSVHLVEESDSSNYDSDSDDFQILTINTDSDADFSEIVQINKRKVKFQLDSGAKCNIMKFDTFKKLKLKLPLKESKNMLKSFSGHRIKPLGVITLPVTVNDKVYHENFQIVELDHNVPNVMGLDSCLKLNLLHKGPSVPVNTIDNDVISEYNDLFEGIGCLPGKHRIVIDKSVPPVIHPPRKIPLAMKAKVKEELDRMEKLDIIEKQTKPTKWVNSFVAPVKSNEKIRICIDPRDLNKAIQREHYPLKTIEDVTEKLKGAKVFSKVDSTSSFWQIQLDKESSELCTFNTPFGRYSFKRVPFGINSASEVYQRIICDMVQDLEGVESIIDDIIIYGKDMEEHDRRLKALLQRCREYNLKLSKDKCVFRTNQIRYVGHLLTDKGVKIDPEKLKAVESMKQPENVEEVQTFLGFINYLAKFLPNMSDKSAPLRELLLNSTEWHWGPEQEESFETLKQMAINAPVLVYYDDSKPLTLTVDSSSKGLGAAIVQEGKPIAYASSALTTTQKNYSQIEKETLAIVFGCKKFHQYIYGRKVTVESDHKPLSSIHKKSMHEMPARLQRFFLELQKYDIEIVYKPGKEMFLADTLSRAYLEETNENLVEEILVNEVDLLSYLAVSPQKYKDIQKATASDPELMTLKNTVQKGWPDKRSECPENIKLYWNYRDEIATLDGLLFKGLKLIIPEVLRKEMLDRVHETHLGTVKSKARAREVMFWPSINKEIEDKVSSCAICAKINMKLPPKEPLMNHETPDRPWARVAADIFEYKNENYLVTVCYYSKWPHLQKLNNMTSKCVIACLKAQIGLYGYFDELVTDNGSNFTSYEFKNFVKEYGFVHTTSSPHFASSNGQAERTVQTVKNILKKNSNPQKALLVYRNTPIDGINLSPAQMFMGRRLKTGLPIATELLKPENPGKVKKKLKSRQQKQKLYHDKRSSKELKSLSQGQKVAVLHDKKWVPGTIVEKHQTPRSYVVETPSGTKLRRNRRHINTTKANLQGGEKELEPEIHLRYETPRKKSTENVSHSSENVSTNQNESRSVVQSESRSPVKIRSPIKTRSVSSSNVKVTKSGREVHVPAKFKDYVP